MFLYELLDILNDNAVITLWTSNQIRIGQYDGKDSLDIVFTTHEGEEVSVSDFEVTDIFPDTYKNINGIGIEIDLDINDYEEFIIF